MNVDRAFPRVFVSSPRYLPGYKDGGALRTIANLVEQTGSKIEFRIVTSDRDAFATSCYPNIERESWQGKGNAKVWYIDRRRLSFFRWRSIINSTEFDVLYLNSIFSPLFSIKILVLRRLFLIRKRPLLLAPRGELGCGALSLKSRKKRMYLWLSKKAGLYRDVVFHASTIDEMADIHRVFGCKCDVRVVADPPSVPPDMDLGGRKKMSGYARFLFLARISRVKNLSVGIHYIGAAGVDCSLTICGPIEDEAYWNECKEASSRYPEHVKCTYIGSVPHNELADVFAAHDFLLLPTLGENFGHVIFESLAHGVPVLISNRTPWRELERDGVGWSVNLDDKDNWLRAIRCAVAMSDSDLAEMRHLCRSYARRYIEQTHVVEENVNLFRLLAGFGPCID